jgi:NAD+ dependent glucose-6-phosphate dehydrogenase
VGDFTDAVVVREALEGINTLIHLAAVKDPKASFHDLIKPNLIGVGELFSIAAEQGVKRIVFASSLHAMMGHPLDSLVDAQDVPRPLNLYGVSKLFGENLGRYYFDQHGIDFIALRIGYVPKAIQHVRRKHLPAIDDKILLTDRDMIRAFHCAIESPTPLYAVVHVTSQPDSEYASLRTARELIGFEPEDSIRDALEIMRCD